MKKITFCLCIVFMVMSITLKAQTTFYYDDFRFAANSGYTSFITSNPNGLAESTLIVRAQVAPPESLFDYTRPANNIGARTDVRDQRAVRLSGNDGGGNFLGTTWIVTDAVDLSTKANAIVSFATRSRFKEGAGGDPFTLMYATNYTDGTDPSTVTWTDITANVVSLSTDAFGVDDAWTYAYLDLSAFVSLSGSDKFAFAFKYDFNDDGVFNSSTNRNGSWFISDVRFVENSPVLSTSSNVIEKNISVYPNPVESTLNINAINNIEIKELSLINVLGKTVYTAKGVNQIDVSNFAKGIYILKVTSSNNGILNKKVIVD
ncbi:T9SS type A sorting domain-containing protein [Flavivirga abyssicola]|uniref:T9SS type A sorting domain-containing protein n=1 Tax=Flavivirga abyssicola TaxID=3063533 RepID=UPI0026DF63ED|nr:T9SS type A sorting domain-containing protein [Flavivirga sp. MEBiC07777]WVK12661.1 T9SS type A sorting domain-containing protein [Flavivirga sp. MEBiC07777]